MNDEHIVDLLKSNAYEKAFVALYKYFPVIKKLIISNGGNKEDAEDVFQDALIVVYKKVNEVDFKLTASLNTYLYSVCKFMWNDLAKKQIKYTAVAIDENLSIEWEETISQEHNSKLAEKVFNDLAAHCKQILSLFYLQAKKMSEIMQLMNYNSENTAKTQKYKCLEGAKNKLKEYSQTQSNLL